MFVDFILYFKNTYYFIILILFNKYEMMYEVKTFKYSIQWQEIHNRTFTIPLTPEKVLSYMDWFLHYQHSHIRKKGLNVRMKTTFIFSDS